MLEIVAREVLDRLHDGCQVVGFDWRYRYVNAAVAAQCRSTPGKLVGLTIMECFPGIDESPMFAVLRRCMTDRTSHRMDSELTRSDGTRGWFDLRFLPVPEGMCILSSDVTSTKVTAHDVNNNLLVILSYSSLLLDELADDDPRREDALEIMHAGRRAAELTRTLLPSRRVHAKP